uniref:Fido domain-containing protein n=1 Tax=Globodera pallida TaxID=36090 RepID=A0A183BZK7_GLOPA
MLNHFSLAQLLEEIRAGQITPPSLFASDEASFDALQSLSTKGGDFTIELLRKLHVIAMAREAPTYAGRLRRENGEPPSGTIGIGASHIAPVHSKVAGLAEKFVKWINEEEATKDMGFIKFVAEAHIRLVNGIHPYRMAMDEDRGP